MDDLMSLISIRLDTKEKLKNEFIYILENYIRAREAFNMMTSGKDKDGLIHKNHATYQTVIAYVYQYYR